MIIKYQSFNCALHDLQDSRLAQYFLENIQMKHWNRPNIVDIHENKQNFRIKVNTNSVGNVFFKLNWIVLNEILFFQVKKSNSLKEFPPMRICSLRGKIIQASRVWSKKENMEKLIKILIAQIMYKLFIHSHKFVIKFLTVVRNFGFGDYFTLHRWRCCSDAKRIDGFALCWATYKIYM